MQKGYVSFWKKNLFSKTTMHNSTEKPFFGEVLCILCKKKTFFPTFTVRSKKKRTTKISYFISHLIKPVFLCFKPGELGFQSRKNWSVHFLQKFEILTYSAYRSKYKEHYPDGLKLLFIVDDTQLPIVREHELHIT